MKEFLKESISYEIPSVYKHKNVVPEILNIAAAEKNRFGYIWFPRGK